MAEKVREFHYVVYKQALHLEEAREVTQELHAKGDERARGGERKPPPLAAL